MVCVVPSEVLLNVPSVLLLVVVCEEPDVSLLLDTLVVPECVVKLVLFALFVVAVLVIALPFVLPEVTKSNT